MIERAWGGLAIPGGLTQLFMDPVIASWIQTFIYFITLLVLIFQTRTFIMQNKNQEEAIRLQTEAIKISKYEKDISDYSNMERSLLFNGLYDKIYDELNKRGCYHLIGWENYSHDDKLMYAYFYMHYEILERVFTLKNDGWLSKEQWDCWMNWLDVVIKHPIFSDVHTDNLGMFHSSFQSYISNRLNEISKEDDSISKSNDCS